MDNYKQRFKDVLTGFEKFSYSKDIIIQHLGDFEMALHDLNACLKCDGDACRTLVNHRCKNLYYHQYTRCPNECYQGNKSRDVYYALWKKACRPGVPGFAFFACPGPASRRETIYRASYTRNREEAYF